MDATVHRYIYRCLPLLIANQAGWLALNNHEIRVTWNGDDDPSVLTIEYLCGDPSRIRPSAGSATAS
jgi:hypothetical protein